MRYITLCCRAGKEKARCTKITTHWFGSTITSPRSLNLATVHFRYSRSRAATRQVHLSEKTTGTGKAPLDRRYYHAVAAALTDVEAILVCGPANAKLELMAHMKSHDALVAERVLPLLTVDHPSDGQLAALAREHFKSDPRMQNAA